MKLIVGLGNPGKEYQKTRHNIGFMALDLLAQQLGAEFQEKKDWQAEVAEANHAGEKILLVKPLTYMNNSGQAIRQIADYFKIGAADIWIISDDIDLPLGRIRTRGSGSSGGHHGLDSVEALLGTQEYTRIRLGIGPVSEEGDLIDTPYKTAQFVLAPFDAREEIRLTATLRQAVDVVLDGLTNKGLAGHTITVDLSR